MITIQTSTRSSEQQQCFLTDQGQVGQLPQTLAFVQDSLPLVVDGLRTIAGLAAQLDVAALQQLAVHPATRLGGLHWRSRGESDRQPEGNAGAAERKRQKEIKINGQNRIDVTQPVAGAAWGRGLGTGQRMWS